MSALKRALRIGGMTGLAITGYAAYAQYAIRRFEHLDPLNADAPGSYLDIDGTAIHYVEAGRGEDVVLIHGWNGSTFSFRYTIPELAQRYRVIAIDLMGYGYSARMRDADYSLTGQSEIVAQAMDRLGVTNAAVIGHSMGGAVATRLALRHPDWVRKLVLVDSVNVTEMRRATRFGKLLRVVMPLGAPLLLHPYRSRRRIFLTAVHDPAYLTPEIEEGYFRPMHMKGHLRSMGQQLTSRQDDDLLSPSDITQPTLILWGEHDSWLRPELGERLNAEIPDSRLTLVPSAGHLPLEEQPDFCNREILRFLQDDEASDGAALAAEAETAS
ncbi:MAG: alpha/beta hydrolase [Chloroflexi bacterium]|nr:alpha/beta hydrolase [Chloroflexota bacterium]